MGTKTWDGGATGNWNVSSNWSPAGVPITGDDVVIDTVGCDVTLDVHIGAGQTNTGLGSLTMTQGTLDTNDGSNRLLTVTGKTEITTGTLTLNASTCLFNSGGTAGGLVLNANATVLADAGSTVTMGSIEAAYDSSINIRLAGTNTINNYRSSTDKTMKLPPGVVDPASSTTSFTVTTSATNTEVSAVNLVDLTFTPASGTPNFNLDSGYGGIDIEGNITISAGVTITTNNQPFTIGKQCNLAGTLICGTTDVSVASGLADGTGTLGMRLQSGGTLTGGSGDHTYGTFNADASGTISVTLTSGITTINGSFTDGIAWGMRSGPTFSNGGGDIHFTGTANQYLYERNNTARTLGDVVVNKSGGTLQWYNGGGAVYTMATLTVTAGTYSSVENTSGTSKDLTVTGQVLVNGGTLALGAATCDFGDVSQSSGIIYGQTSTINLNTGTGGGWVWYRTGGTWDYGTSTVVYKSNGKHMEGEFYNLTIECASSTHTGVWRADGLASVNMVAAGALLLKEGKLKRDAAAEDMIVTGNVTLEMGSTLGLLSDTGDNTFGALDIAGGSTFVATRGNTSIATGNFNNSGSFIHNDGTFKFTHATNTQNMQSAGTVEPTFYILDNAQDASGGTVVVWKSITVIHTLSQTGGRYFQFKGDEGSLTVTLGSSTVACTVTEGNRCLATLSGAGPVNIYGADQLKPFVITTGGPNHACTEVHYKWGNYTSETFNTQHNITIDGDMKFGGFNVNAGDELDLNGQRVEFTGAFDLTASTSALKMNGALAVFTNTIDFNGRVPTSNTATTIIHNPPSASEKAITSLYFGGTFFAQGAESDVNGYAWGGSSGEYPAKVFVGGQLDCQQSVKTNTLMQVATGGELRGNDRTLTCEGDFTTSGGLLGASCLDINASTSSQEHYSTVSAVAVGTNAAWTIEGWIKRDNGSTGNSVFVELRVDGSNANRVFVNVDTDDIQFLVWSNGGSGGEITTVGAGLNDGKWHHIACTYDSTTAQIFIDGKLSAQGDINKTTDNTDDRIINVGANVGTYDNEFLGAMDDIRIWSDVRTPTEIRSNMFNEVSTGDGLVQYWKFNEGTGDSANATVGNTLLARVGSNSASSQSASLWAGSGTFTRGTSTVKLTGNGSASFAGTSTEFNNLEVASSSKTTTFVSVGGDDKRPVIRGTLTHGGGTLTTSTNCSITIGSGGTVSSGTNTSGLYFTRWDSVNPIPALTSKYLSLQQPCDFAGNQNAEQYIQFRHLHNIGDFNVTTARIISYVSSTVIMGAGTIEFTSTTGWGSNVYDNRVFTAGPGATIKGVGAKSGFASGNNWSVVGKIENLDVTNEELKVTGQVINCTGDIHQYFPTIDHSQQLDADTADDRDVKLGRDLDKNTELINS